MNPNGEALKYFYGEKNEKNIFSIFGLYGRSLCE